jgi:hypothetical protein
MPANNRSWNWQGRILSFRLQRKYGSEEIQPPQPFCEYIFIVLSC